MKTELSRIDPIRGMPVAPEAAGKTNLKIKLIISAPKAVS